MLCISRYDPGEVAWVYDLDTHIETPISTRRLLKKIRGGLQVEGASIEDDDLVLRPYQFDYSPDVVRTVLVDKVLYQKVGERLVYLEPMRDGDVVLSNYALKLGRGSLIPVKGVRYIFDEKLKDIEPGVIRQVNTSTVTVACHDLCDQLAVSLYESLQFGLTKIEDHRDRSYSMRSIVAIKRRCFVRAYSISRDWQAFAHSVLCDLILPHFPQGSTAVAINDFYHGYYGRSEESWMSCLLFGYDRHIFLTQLAEKKVIRHRAEYNSLVRAMSYVFHGGTSPDIISLLNRVFE